MNPQAPLRLEGIAGEPVRATERLGQWPLAVMASSLGVALVLLLMSAGEYVEGRGIVHFDGRLGLTARESGVVTRVHVQSGDFVTRGSLLLSLEDDMLRARQIRFEREWELQLAKLLLNPGDAVTRQTLSSLRAEREHQAALLEQRSLRAPEEGTVAEIWVRTGHAVRPGERLVSLLTNGAKAKLVVVLPAKTLPFLTVGQDVRFRLDGFRLSYESATLDSITSEVVDSQDLRRILGGGEYPDLTSGNGPLAVATATLSGEVGEPSDTPFPYQPGMRASAWVKLRRSSLLEIAWQLSK
jgi:multidrug resistance efflux pump